MSTNPAPPAGWYPDPEDAARTRYWDGSNWAAPSTPPSSSGPQGTPAYPRAYGAYNSAPRSPDYLAWSIINLVCLCLPLGIVALVFSVQARGATDPATAEDLSVKAKNMNIAASIGGAIILALYFTVLRNVHAS